MLWKLLSALIPRLFFYLFIIIVVGYINGDIVTCLAAIDAETPLRQSDSFVQTGEDPVNMGDGELSQGSSQDRGTTGEFSRQESSDQSVIEREPDLFEGEETNYTEEDFDNPNQYPDLTPPHQTKRNTIIDQGKDLLPHKRNRAPALTSR